MPSVKITLETCRLLIIGGLMCANSLHAAEQPNIILILADDLGYGDVSFTVKDAALVQTPNIDRIADEGVTLANFYACSVCSPTRAGTLTGRWPITMGLQRSVVAPWHKRGLEPEVLTLPEILGEHGYERRACIGKWHLGHSAPEYRPLAHGFTHFYGHLNGAIDYFSHQFIGENDWFRQDQVLVESGYATDLLTDDAIAFIREAKNDPAPFFLYLAYNAPHSPFNAPEDEISQVAGLEGKQRIYAAMINVMDRGIGRILDELDAQGIADNTLVLFFSDNGGVRSVTAKTHLKGGKFTLYEGGQRVCAAVRWPAGGLVGGRTINSNPIGYIDVLPTLCAAAGIDLTADEAAELIDGMDTLPVMRGQTKGPNRYWYNYLNQSHRWDVRSVIHYPYKLVLTEQYDDAGQLVKYEEELFDLENSPSEDDNIAATHQATIDELKQAMDTFMSRQTNPVPYHETGKEGFTPPKDWVLSKDPI